MRLQQRHQAVDRGRGHRVIVAQAGVRSIHQRAKVLRVRTVGGLQHARVLGQHVAHALSQGIGQTLRGLEVGHVTQGIHP
jgi:hypothetical protein